MFFIFSLILVSLLIFLNKLFNVYQTDSQKLAPFECGILEIGDASQSFDISFFVIAILFLIFDLEIILLFPYASIFFSLSFFGFWSFFFILFILTLALVYEILSLSSL